jgi:hypothetical protein
MATVYAVALHGSWRYAVVHNSQYHDENRHQRSEHI